MQLKKKHQSILEDIDRVDNNLVWADIEILLKTLGCTITNGSGSRIKVNIGNSIWSVHLSEKKIKFGIIRELRKILKLEGFL